MTNARFLETRSAAWDRLEALVTKTGRKGVSALSDEELHELTRLYPAAAVDVARARTYKLDPNTQRRINRLAIAAHGLLYRRQHVERSRAIWRFLTRDYPRLFRRLWIYTVLAVVLFFTTGLSAYVSTRIHPSTAYLFVPYPIDLPESKPGLTAEDISERFRRIPNPPIAAGVMANNISVAFRAFAYGITAGVGTCYVVLVNATMLGGLAAHFANHGLSYPFWSFILPHGILEIMAILIAAAAGLRLGMSLALPGAVTRRASLRAGAREAVFLVLGTIPMFIVAGTIEGFITPSQLAGGVKIIVGMLAGGLALSYLVLAGRERTDGRAPSQAPSGKVAPQPIAAALP